MNTISCDIPESGKEFLRCTNEAPFDLLELLSTFGTVGAVIVALYFGWKSHVLAQETEGRAIAFQRHQDQLAALRVYMRTMSELVANCTHKDFDTRTFVNNLTSDWLVYAMYFKPDDVPMYELTHGHSNDIQAICSQLGKAADMVRAGTHTGAGMKSGTAKLIEANGNWMGNLAEWHAMPNKRTETFEKLSTVRKFLDFELGALMRKDEEENP